MNDGVRLSAEQFRSIYERGFIVWGRLYQRVIESPQLPAFALVGRSHCQQQPSLPPNLSLKLDTRGASASGSSVWNSGEPDCDHGLPSFRLPLSIKVAMREPVSLSVSLAENVDPTYVSYFEREKNYIPLLMLAWAYILSARWTEIMPGSCSLSYTHTQATQADESTNHPVGEESASVYIGDECPEEARWWAAILSPGRGWEANMTRDGQETLVSPWSIRLQTTSPHFLLHVTSSLKSSKKEAASFSAASSYLQNFCTRHNVIDQSRAALASVLLLPSMSSFKDLRLPNPKVLQWEGATGSTFDGCTDDNILQSDHVDKLLALSCHTRGLRAMLLSAFYEPSIECNAVTPWIQGSLAAIDHLASTKPHIVGRMCMERVPQVAFLWLGSLILGQQGKLLQEVRFGQLPVDLTSAAWSGTTQSFLQQPVSQPLVGDGGISRADECRLLYLSQCGQHSRSPVCQWKPFGATFVEDVDIEVRTHQHCKYHQLQYQKMLWECVGGTVESPSSQRTHSQASSKSTQPQTSLNSGSVAISYGALNRDREAISENATRSIFGWLRSDGRTRQEGEIWKHEWFDMSDSGDDEDLSEDEKTSGGSPKLQVSSYVETWLSGVGD